jgi:hypothetical protein
MGNFIRITKISGPVGDRAGIKIAFGGMRGNKYTVGAFVRRGTATTTGFAPYVDAPATGGISFLSAIAPISLSDPVGKWTRISRQSYDTPVGAAMTGAGTAYCWVESSVGDYIDVKLPEVELGPVLTSPVVVPWGAAVPYVRGADNFWPTGIPAATNRIRNSGDLTKATWDGCPRAITGLSYLGVPYCSVTKATTGANESCSSAVINTIAAGETLVTTLALRANTASTVSVGLLTGADWGAATDSTCEILSGIGTISQISGSLWAVMNLLGTSDTVVKITRKFTAAASAALYIYPGMNTSTTSGDSVLVTCIQVENDVATPYIPTTDSIASRAAASNTGLIYSNVPENDYVAWNSGAMYVTGSRVMDSTTHKVYESITGVLGTATSAGGTFPLTMLKADGTVYVPAIGTAVSFGGTLPSGVVNTSIYYVLATSGNAFSISLTKGGAAVTVGVQAGAFSCAASNNYNQPVTNVSYWLDAGYNNRWDMFDDSVTSQTTQAGDVTVVFNPGARLDSIAGLNMAANNMKIAFTDLTTGVTTYSAKVNLVSNSGVQNFYSYLYEPIVQMPDCLVDGIPLGLSTNSVITVTFQSNGTSKVGGLVFGLSKDIGVTEWGAKVGIVDYSVKTKDAFGNYNITPRAFSKKGDFTVQVPTGQVDALQNLLAQYRSTPIVYIGSNTGKDRTQFNSTIIYGFYKDFDISIAYNAFSACSISIEGLT